MTTLLGRGRGRVFALAVVLLLLAAAGVVVAARSHRPGSTPGGADLASNAVDVVGCPHPDQVQVAVRTVTRSVRPARDAPADLVAPVRRVKPSPSPAPTPSTTPSPTPTATATPSPTPPTRPTFAPLPGLTAGPTVTSRPTVTARPTVPRSLVVEAVVFARPSETPGATVSHGKFHLAGLTQGQVYQVGAMVPGCSSAKVVVAQNGFFVAGRTQVPPVAVVRTPTVSLSGSTATFDAGAPAAWTLSAGDAPQTCALPKGAVAHGDLSGSAGTFRIDPSPAATAEPGVPFHGSLNLTIRQKDGPCVPSLDLHVPLVLAGLPQDGITQLEIYDWPHLDKGGFGNCDVCLPGPYNELLWKGSSAFDWDDPAASTRPFHWASTAPGTTDGQWQLSADPLPDTCHPDGLLASGATGYQAGPLDPGSEADPPNFTVNFAHRDLDHGTTYFLRVVPRNAQGGCSGPASPSVTVAWKPTPDSPKLPVPQPAPEFAHLETSLLGFQKLTGPADSPPYCFQALKDHDVDSDITGFANDPVGWLTAGAGGHIASGQQVCFAPSGDSGGGFWDDLTDVVDFVLDVVSFPAKVYDLYEQIIPNILAELIPGCDDTCRGYLLTAEKVALAAVGLPPSLPDASKIVNDGEAYLVAQAADATGLPEDVVQAAYDKGKQAMIDQLAAVSSNQTGFSCDWCAFDNGVRAPWVKVQVTRPASDDPSLPVPTKICADDFYHVVKSAAPDYVAAPLYYGSCAVLPTHFAPGKSLVLRLGLTPNVDQIRQKVLNDFYASKSQLGGSASQIDAQAFHGWLGQEQNTPLMGFNAVTVGTYDAGPSYGTREAKLGTSGYFFAQ